MMNKFKRCYLQNTSVLPKYMPEGFMLNRFWSNNDCCKIGNKVKITSDVVTYFQVHKRINRFGIIWGKGYQYLSI